MVYKKLKMRIETLLKTSKKNSFSRRGFSLIEVLAASTVLLMVAGVTTQLLIQPRDKVIMLEQRSLLLGHLDHELKQAVDTVPFANQSTATCSTCNMSMCGSSVCTSDYSTNCAPSATLVVDTDSASKLNQMVSSNSSNCYAKIVVDPVCDSTFSNDQSGRQICVGGTLVTTKGKLNEALSTFAFHA